MEVVLYFPGFRDSYLILDRWLHKLADLQAAAAFLKCSVIMSHWDISHQLNLAHPWQQLVRYFCSTWDHNAAMVPKSICGRTMCLPPPFAIHHVSRLVPSLILQWLRIIVPPVAGFNYSHDAKAQAVAAITSSITKNYGSANLQMHCLPVALCVAMCVCAIYDKHLGSKLLMLVFIIFRWVWD